MHRDFLNRRSSWVVRVLLVGLLAGGVLFTGCHKHPTRIVKAKRVPYPPEDATQVIDLSHFYKDRLGNDAAGIAHRQILDGLPFHVDGRVVVFGQSQVNWDNRGKPNANAGSHYPDKTGIPVNRKFEELHLIHATYWPDVEGETIALIRLNYADGTKAELPIIYGGHVRDFQRIRTEESETMSDPDTKIIWRGPGNPGFKSTQRAFKSRLMNPSPEKLVVTMDVVSTHHRAAYQLLAATVAQADFRRAVSPPVPSGEPERHFNDTMMIQVTDEATGLPVRGALVNPFMDVDGPYMVAAPFYTDAAGQGVIRYPKERTQHISMSVEMTGYVSGHDGWAGDFPATNVVQLAHVPLATAVQ
jgi:hypothetical protein